MRLTIVFCVLFCTVFGGIGFAESPGISIVEPLDGSTVNPGQEITVRAEAVGGFVLKDGWVAIGRFEEEFTVLPVTVTVTIPKKVAGKIILDVLGKDLSGKFASDEITLNVQQTATLQSLKFYNDFSYRFETDWDGNVNLEDKKQFAVIGVYSDGITREMPIEDLTFVSSDPSIASVDSQGVVRPHKVGEATITISSSGVNKVVSVFVKKPTGIRPSEFIPPTTQISIEPQPNSAGWNNSDITITLTAADNEGGSGVREIIYQLNSQGAGLNFIQGNTAMIVLSQEGLDRLVYYAVDNEVNDEESRLVDFKLDRIPPEVAITAPGNEAEYLLNSYVIASWLAMDALSGLKSATGSVTPGSAVDTTTAGAKTFSVVATDNADNKIEVPCSYYVRYSYGGILPPINQDGSSVFKLGKVVPVKFQLKDDAGNYIPTAVAKIYLSKINDNVVGTEIEAESQGEANTGNLFRYDSVDNQYIFNLGTKNLSQGTWQIKIVLDDGTSKYVTISLK